MLVSLLSYTYSASKKCERCHKPVLYLTKKKCETCYRQETYKSKQRITTDETDFKPTTPEKLKSIAISVAKSIAGSPGEFCQLIAGNGSSQDSNASNLWTMTEKIKQVRKQNRETRQYFSENAKSVYNGEISSFRSFDRSMTRMFSKGHLSQNENKKKIRIKTLHGVNMARPPCTKTVRKSMFDHLEGKIQLIQREIPNPLWPKQGTCVHTSIDQLLLDHLQNLWNLRLMRTDIGLSDNNSLVIYLSISSDGSRLGRCEHSYHYSVLLSVIMNNDIWLDEIEHVVKRPIPILITCDRETTDTMFWAGKYIAETVKVLRSVKNWYFNQKTGFMKIQSDFQHHSNDENQTNENNGLSVRLKVLLFNGDGKTQQIINGSNSGSSQYRCFCCFTSVDEWLNSESSFSLELPSRTISFGYLKYKEGCLSDFGDHIRRVAPRTSSLLPNSFESIEDTESFLNEHDLWSVWVTADPLHIVLGHSAALMKYLVKVCPRTEALLLSELLKKHCECEFKKGGHSGWKWRLIWGSFPVTWSLVFTEKAFPNERMLIFSWTQCCLHFYQKNSKRCTLRWFRFFTWALKHFTLWTECRGMKVNLYSHLLWPHMVEQSWWLGFSCALMESHEHSWVVLKKFWRLCASSKNSTPLMTKRWLTYLKLNQENYETRDSSISARIKAWWSGFGQLKYDNVEIYLRDKEALSKLIDYLRKKLLPKELYSFDENENSLRMTIFLSKLSYFSNSGTLKPITMDSVLQNDLTFIHSLPILPKMNIVESFLRNDSKFKWEEMKSQFNLQYGLRSPILMPFSIVIENIELANYENEDGDDHSDEDDDPLNQLDLDKNLFDDVCGANEEEENYENGSNHAILNSYAFENKMETLNEKMNDYEIDGDTDDLGHNDYDSDDLLNHSWIAPTAKTREEFKQETETSFKTQTTQNTIIIEDSDCESLKEKSDVHRTNNPEEKIILDELWASTSLTKSEHLYREIYKSNPPPNGSVTMFDKIIEILSPKDIDILKMFLIEKSQETIVSRNSFDGVRVESLHRLLKREYLNDELINWYMGNLYTEGCGPSISFLSTYCYVTSNYTPPAATYIPHSRVICGPCLFGDNHWGFIGYDKVDKKGFWGDPLNCYQLSEAHIRRFTDVLQKQKVIESRNDSIFFERILIPKQNDLWSCGVHVLKALQKISRNKLLKWSSSNSFVERFKSKFVLKLIRRFL